MGFASSRAGACGDAPVWLNPSFCNGPLLVNPFYVVRPPGSRFCTGSARGRHLMGCEEDRSTNLPFAWSSATGWVAV